MKKITDLINEKFTISAEIIPPRNGSNFKDLKQKVLRLAAQDPDFISITKGAGGSLRGGSLPLAHFIESLDIPALSHFTCRDYTIEDVENTLIDHHYFKINNILALRGDPPANLIEEYKPRDGSYSNACELVKHINKMNHGKYLVRKNYDEKNLTESHGDKTDFCIGVACYPEYDKGIENLKDKIIAGAEFAITQMIFNSEAFAKFQNQFNIPVLPGLHLLSNKKQAEFISTHMKINIPSKVMANADNKEWMFSYTIDLIDQFKSGGAKGVHLFIIQNNSGTIELMNALQKKYR